MTTPSRTPWKKSRTFGDIHGGRTRRRLTDNIFNRLHSLQKPAPGEPLPVLLQENPSRDFYFPISTEEARAVLEAHAGPGLAGLTHIWFRRNSRSRGSDTPAPRAEFICGSGVRVIVLYPIRKDGLIPMGAAKPSEGMVRPYLMAGGKVKERDGRWFVAMEAGAARDFFVQHLLMHEFAHHLDWFNRQWSNANCKQVEDFANQYAVSWGAEAVDVLNHLDQSSPR